MSPRAAKQRALLDVNVLIALAFPTHVHHAAALDWFVEKGRAAWATCALTESAFVRLSSNPRISGVAITPQAAAAQLRLMVREGSHVYWSDATSMASDPSILDGVVGYKQVTDAHLLRVAHDNGGRLATFDTSIEAFAPAREIEILRWDP